MKKTSPSAAMQRLLAVLPTMRTVLHSNVRISGYTHRFYRYPARFSPQFASAAITEFSEPNAIVLDPYMGGGTSIIEAIRLGRRAVGCDLNALGVFVARVKTTPLNDSEQEAVRAWAENVIPKLRYDASPHGIKTLLSDERTHNLQIPRARALKKQIGLMLLSASRILDGAAADFARCAILNAGQWALHGRRMSPSLTEFRKRTASNVMWMLSELDALSAELHTPASGAASVVLIHGCASNLAVQSPFCLGDKADLVVTSPPYLGIHVLYHRWQVDGRRESPAPYWISQMSDGQGSAFYNFADRRQPSSERYFREALRTLRSVRAVVKRGSVMVQLVAFSSPMIHLRRYLETMEAAGFTEMRISRGDRLKRAARIWRDVPNRAWHAAQKGTLCGAREVVLFHEAV